MARWIGFSPGYRAGERVDGVLRLLDGEGQRVQPVEGVAPRPDDVHRPEGLRHRHAQHAANGELLVDHLVGQEPLRGPTPLEPRHHDAPAAHRDGDRVGERPRRVGRGVHHHLGAAAGGLAHLRDDVARLHVDGRVGAQLAGERELRGVAREPGDDHLPRARLAGGDHAAEPALARAENDHAVAGAGGRHRARPGETGGQRIEHHRHLRGRSASARFSTESGVRYMCSA